MSIEVEYDPCYDCDNFNDFGCDNCALLLVIKRLTKEIEELKGKQIGRGMSTNANR